jgi:hypothetical protein
MTPRARLEPDRAQPTSFVGAILRYADDATAAVLRDHIDRVAADLGRRQ